MTKNEAVERAAAIWGEGCQVSLTKTGTAYVFKGGFHHTLDENGHTACHKECSAIEDGLTHLVGCPKEADPRNETCGCAAIRAERDARDATGRKAMSRQNVGTRPDAAQRTSRPDPLAAAVVLSLVDSIEGLLDAPAFANQEALVGDDVRAIELAKANAAAALKFFPPRPSSGEYRPTASGLNLALELVATAIAECGAEGVHPDELFEGFRRYGGSRELFDAMVKTLQSSTRALVVGGRLVAVDTKKGGRS